MLSRFRVKPGMTCKVLLRRSLLMHRKTAAVMPRSGMTNESSWRFRVKPGMTFDPPSRL